MFDEIMFIKYWKLVNCIFNNHLDPSVTADLYIDNAVLKWNMLHTIWIQFIRKFAIAVWRKPFIINVMLCNRNWISNDQTARRNVMVNNFWLAVLFTSITFCASQQIVMYDFVFDAVGVSLQNRRPKIQK